MYLDELNELKDENRKKSGKMGKNLVKGVIEKQQKNTDINLEAREVDSRA